MLRLSWCHYNQNCEYWNQTLHEHGIMKTNSISSIYTLTRLNDHFSCCITSTFSIDFLIHLVTQYNYRNVYLGTHYKHKLKLFSQTIAQYQVVQLLQFPFSWIFNALYHNFFFSVIKYIKQDQTFTNSYHSCVWHIQLSNNKIFHQLGI